MTPLQEVVLEVTLVGAAEITVEFRQMKETMRLMSFITTVT